MRLKFEVIFFSIFVGSNNNQNNDGEGRPRKEKYPSFPAETNVFSFVLILEILGYHIELSFV